MNNFFGNSNTVSVIIATLNREFDLVNTVESVLNLNPLPDEIWIIDQTTQHEPDVESYLTEIRGRGVKVVRLPEPGVCFARNLGAALSDADIIIYLDDDVIIENPAFIQKHRECYFNPEVDAVLGQILAVGQESTTVGKCDEENKNNDFAGTRLNTIVTANCSIRRRVIIETGGFDEVFSGRTYANEDGDFGLRLYNGGHRIVYCPEASLIHLKSPSGGNRITGRDSFPEWTRSVTFFQYYLRHSSGFKRLWKLLTVFRLIALRKENVLEPWCLPNALLHAI
jgi:glycosyltransferase involved in cell wall biosynthesis